MPFADLTDRDHHLIKKSMNMTTSDQGDAAAGLNRAMAILAKANLTWEEYLAGLRQDKLAEEAAEYYGAPKRPSGAGSYRQDYDPEAGKAPNGRSYNGAGTGQSRATYTKDDIDWGAVLAKLVPTVKAGSFRDLLYDFQRQWTKSQRLSDKQKATIR